MNNHNLHQKEGFFGIAPKPKGRLKERFTMLPFSVMNTREGDWISRRRLWLAKGIKSELGRDGALTYQIPLTLSDGTTGHRTQSQTSIFDPVIAELVYSWWCPPGGVILDPFAGGSVRGIVASVLGFKYFGIELREEQVEANKQQLNDDTTGKFKPVWRQGDSAAVVPTLKKKVDFIFSCPPYGNLEKYSDEGADISNMTHSQFLEIYTKIIADSVALLKDNRFACFVVANYRSQDKDGKQMHDFVGQTIKAFEDAGAMFYNDIVLLNQVGTGAMRCNTIFVKGARKTVKMHQNVLVFVKGDPKEAVKHIPLVDHTATEEEGGANE